MVYHKILHVTRWQNDDKIVWLQFKLQCVFQTRSYTTRPQLWQMGGDNSYRELRWLLPIASYLMPARAKGMLLFVVVNITVWEMALLQKRTEPLSLSLPQPVYIAPYCDQYTCWAHAAWPCCWIGPIVCATPSGWVGGVAAVKSNGRTLIHSACLLQLPAKHMDRLERHMHTHTHCHWTTTTTDNQHQPLQFLFLVQSALSGCID